MGLVEIVTSVKQQRQQFTDQFKKKFLEDSLNYNPSQKFLNEINSALNDDDVIKYYRFSNTVVNELIAFVPQKAISNKQELEYGLSLLLFWLRFTDNLIDVKKEQDSKINLCLDYIKNYNASDITSISKLSSAALREHSIKYDYFEELIPNISLFFKSLKKEAICKDNLFKYSESKKQTGISGANTAYAIITPFISLKYQKEFDNFKKFFTKQAISGMYLDTLCDIDGDFKKGISPSPNIINKSYFLYKTTKTTINHLLSLPSNLNGIAKVLTYATASSINIILDSKSKY